MISTVIRNPVSYAIKLTEGGRIVEVRPMIKMILLGYQFVMMELD